MKLSNLSSYGSYRHNLPNGCKMIDVGHPINYQESKPEYSLNQIKLQPGHLWLHFVHTFPSYASARNESHTFMNAACISGMRESSVHLNSFFTCIAPSTVGRRIKCYYTLNSKNGLTINYERSLAKTASSHTC